MRLGCVRHDTHRRFSGGWLRGGKRSSGKPGAGRRRGDLVSLTKFLLVGERRYRGSVLRISLGLHEYGGADRRSHYRFADTLDSAATGLDCIISCGRRNKRFGSSGVAAGRPHRYAVANRQRHGAAATPDSDGGAMITPPDNLLAGQDTKRPKA